MFGHSQRKIAEICGDEHFERVFEPKNIVFVGFLAGGICRFSLPNGHLIGRRP
jgi:hypothetical protein